MQANKTCLAVVTTLGKTGGGIAQVDRLVLHTLLDLDYQVELFILQGDTLSGQDTVQKIKPRTEKTYSGNKVNFVLSVWKKLFSCSPGLVYCDHVNLAALFLPIQILKRFPLVVWLHGIEVFSPKPSWEGHLGLRAAWRLLASSEYTARKVNTSFPRLNIQTCELALDVNELPEQNYYTTRLSAFVAVDGSSQILGDQAILLVGRMEFSERYKGHAELLAAFPLVASNHPQTQLILAGDGNDRERLLGIARQLPSALQSRIFMPGYVDQALLERLYQACFAFALPSRGEGFGLVYLEAMARGKPCIGGGMDAAGTVIQDGITGLLVADPSDPGQVALAISTLLDDPSQAMTMGQAGLERVKENFLFPNFKERFLSAIVES